MSRRTPAEILTDALEHLETMQAYARFDLDDQLVVDAICMRLSAAIEALAALDATFRDELFAAQWPLMWGMRNRIAHGYLVVDGAIVRATLRDDIPHIVDRIRSALAAGSDPHGSLTSTSKASRPLGMTTSSWIAATTRVT